jgi:hypothetical protein
VRVSVDDEEKFVGTLNDFRNDGGQLRQFGMGRLCRSRRRSAKQIDGGFYRKGGGWFDVGFNDVVIGIGEDINFLVKFAEGRKGLMDQRLDEYEA